MAQATCNYSRFHNFSNEALADAIGNADLALKAHEAEVKALKEKFKSRGLLTAAGEHFSVTRSDQISSRLDVAAAKAFLGVPWRSLAMLGGWRSTHDLAFTSSRLICRAPITAHSLVRRLSLRSPPARGRQRAPLGARDRVGSGAEGGEHFLVRRKSAGRLL
jgi:hypothetical protein